MVKFIPRVRGTTERLYLVALLGVVLLLVVIAYLPFRFDPPRVERNDVARTAGGALRFGEMNQARTAGTPVWLADARSSGIVQIDLEVDPRASQEQAPASIMMLARDFWHSDFAIGQNHSELLVWLRRPGSDANGNPAFAVSGALRAGEWNRIDVLMRGDRIRIDVNGTRRLAEQLPANALREWGQGRLALGDEVHGGGPWQGKIRQAEVRTPGHAVDYIRPGSLYIPAHYLYLPDHFAPFPPIGRGEWEAIFLHWVSFIPVGFLIVRVRRRPVRFVPATLLAAGFAVLLAAGKFLFHGRHTGAVDIAVQAAGALLGAWVARQWAQRQTQEQPDSLVRR